MEQMQNLVNILNKHSYNYYVLDNPTISDSEYDKMLDLLIELEKKFGIVLKDSPTLRVGDVIQKGFEKVVHEHKLYSLDKCQSLQELEKWLISVQEKIDNPNFLVEYKLDGLRIVCTYENGYFVRAATRGNGEIGEDVTNQVKTIKSLPLKIDYKGKLIVEGEGIMKLSSFDAYNSNLENEPLKNPRNAVAGAIRNLDSKQTAKRNLDLFFYNINYCDDFSFQTQTQVMEFLKKNKFDTCKFEKQSSNINEIFEIIKGIDKTKNKLDFLIDGAVIKLDNIKQRQIFGFTSKFPKWAMAFKFETQEVTTMLNNIVWQVGRTGKVTPIAEVEEVFVAGANVKRATLNNFLDIKRKNVKLFSKVFIRRSNEVIPEIMGVAEEFENSKEIQDIDLCPCCNSVLEKINGVAYCKNAQGCKDQIIGKLAHFSSRDAMDITGFSESTAKLLFENLNVKNYADLYKITKEQLLSLPKIKDKKAQNIIDSIEKSKNVTFDRFLYAINISGVGKKTARDLSKIYKNLDNLKNASVESLSEIDDIGETISVIVFEYFKDENNLKNIEDLIECGVEIKQPQKQSGNVFEGKSIVVTGTLNEYTRQQISAIIEDNGGNVSSSVSKNTSFIVVGEDAGSKLEKAKKLGIQIVFEQDFKKML